MTKRRKITQHVADVTRRKRHELPYVDYALSAGSAAVSTGGGSTLSTGGGSTCGCPSTCPEEGVNFGPPDARLEWYTAQSTGTVVGHIYNDVSLEGMGFVPGDDVISYCYSARVGPSTGPIELYCDGKLGRIERGLVAIVAPSDLGSYYSTEIAGAFEAHQQAFFGTTSTGPLGVDAAQTGSYGGTKYIKIPGGDGCSWAVYGGITIDGLDGNSGLLQFKYNRSGVCDTWDYVGGPENECWHSNHKDPEDGGSYGKLSLGGGLWGVTRGGGLFTTKQFTVGPGNTSQTYGSNPVSVFSDVPSGGTPYRAGTSWMVSNPYGQYDFFGVGPSVGAGLGAGNTIIFSNEGGRFNGLTPSTKCEGRGIKDIGWYAFWDLWVMRDEKVEWRLGAEGRVVDLGAGAQRSPFGASTEFSGSTSEYTTWTHNIWRAGWSTGPLDGNFGAPYPASPVKIYNTSTLGTPILNCTEPYVWGGDVWAYSSGGFGGVSTGGSTCCTTYVKLNFLDASGNVLSTYGTTGGTNKYAEQRVTGVVNQLIPQDAKTARFTQFKTGACSCYGWADDLMFSEGPCCLHYSPPIIVAIRDNSGTVITSTDGTVIGVSTSITGVWSTSNSTFISGDEIYDSVQEHSRVNLNVLPEAHAEICVASATGTVVGDPWPDVVLVDLGMSTADTLSFRWKVKVST